MDRKARKSEANTPNAQLEGSPHKVLIFRLERF